MVIRQKTKPCSECEGNPVEIKLSPQYVPGDVKRYFEVICERCNGTGEEKVDEEIGLWVAVYNHEELGLLFFHAETESEVVDWLYDELEPYLDYESDLDLEQKLEQIQALFDELSIPGFDYRVEEVLL